MKRKAALLALAAVLLRPAAARSEVTARQHDLSLQIGSAIPFTKAKAGSAPYGVSIAGPGLLLGAQYIYQVTRYFGIGGEAQYSAFHNKIPAGGNNLCKSSVISYEALARLVLWPYAKSYNPYFIAGFGGSSVFLQVEERSTPPQKLVEGNYTYPSVSLGFGVQWEMAENILAGLEGRWRYLGVHTFHAATGDGTLNYGPASEANVAIRMGYKFGGGQSYAGPHVDAIIMEDTTDSGIKAHILGELRSQPGLDVRYLSVDVDAGVVTLSGMIPSLRDKDTATRIARRTKGVDQVLVNITVPE